MSDHWERMMVGDVVNDSLMTADAIHRLVGRVEAIEARQRAWRQHDPGCPAMPQRIGTNRWSVHTGVCDCWLSR